MLNSIKSTKEKEEVNHFLFILSGLLDSNQRPRAPQTCALPTALNPEQLQLHFCFCGCKGTVFLRNFQIF